MRRLVLVLAIALCPTSAAAEVTQPNGVVMPQDSMNGETQLYTLFSSRGEAIDYRADGASEPALFSPLCDFRATLVLNETASHLAVGWYNADPADATPPDSSEIHVIVPVDSPVGTTITGADIRSDAAYAGGLIGFALVGWQTHYTEARYNPICTSCATPGPWIMSVIYRSTTTPNAYYVSFEDGPVGAAPSEFNNDGDYNDYVYFFEGLVCSGGGEGCDTGMPGICAQGLTECSGDGVTCRPSISMRDEACNGLDDDCDGDVDDGELCAEGEVCDRGVCVGRCMGEFGCAAGLSCTPAGLCVEASCADVVCPSGEICREGACAGPCTGVVCPGDRVCRVGRCVDPCEGVTCAADRVCDRGVCVQRCDCAPCADGLACDAASGRCGEPSCAGIDCAPPATVCRAGACVDACEGASCPRGQLCEAGECVPDPSFLADAGTAAPDAGTPARDSGGASMDAGTVERDGGRGRPMVSSGCGCRAPRSSSTQNGIVALLIAGLALVRSRARRRRSRCSTLTR